MDSLARLEEGSGSTQKLSLGGLTKLLQKSEEEEGSLKKLTLRRIKKRQSQGIVNIKLRKTGFETFNFNLKKRAAATRRDLEQPFNISQDRQSPLATSLVSPTKTKNYRLSRTNLP